MNESETWTVTCQDAADESGNLIVDLPAELLTIMDLTLGSELTIEIINGIIVLKPIRN